MLTYTLRASALILSSSLAILAAALSPKDATIVAAWLGPQAGIGEAARVAAALDLGIVRQGALPGLWVLASDRDDLAARLYAYGAWLVMDSMASGCGQTD